MVLVRVHCLQDAVGSARPGGDPLVVPVELLQPASLPGGVADYDTAFGASPTSSFVDHLDRLESRIGSPDASIEQASLLATARALRPLPGQRGVVVGLAGQPVLLELFPSRSALRAHLGELLAGLLLDASAAGMVVEATPGRRARRLVNRLEALKAGPDLTVDAGMGTAFGADSPYAALRGVGVDDRWVHLTVLNRRHSLLTVA